MRSGPLVWTVTLVLGMLIWLTWHYESIFRNEYHWPSIRCHSSLRPTSLTCAEDGT